MEFNHINLYSQGMKAGASGRCTAAPNLLGSLPRQLFDLMKTGDIDPARALFYRILPALRFIVAGGLPTTVKAGLSIQRYEAGVPRLPLQPLPASGKVTLHQLLHDVDAGTTCVDA